MSFLKKKKKDRKVKQVLSGSWYQWEGESIGKGEEGQIWWKYCIHV
jgi:hypothetical protein